MLQVLPTLEEDDSLEFEVLDILRDVDMTLSPTSAALLAGRARIIHRAANDCE